MQAISPGKIRSGKSDLPEGAGDRVAIGDMQHKERLIWELPKVPKLPNIASIESPELAVPGDLRNLGATFNFGDFWQILAVLAIPISAKLIVTA